jgi:hypothetical protein
MLYLPLILTVCIKESAILIAASRLDACELIDPPDTEG